LRSPQYPSFEREVVHPIMGKVAVTLTRAFERHLSEDSKDASTTVSCRTPSIFAELMIVRPPSSFIQYHQHLPSSIPSISPNSSTTPPFPSHFQHRKRSGSRCPSIITSHKRKSPDPNFVGVRDEIGIRRDWDGFEWDCRGWMV
jgi:hypothetical protein